LSNGLNDNLNGSNVYFIIGLWRWIRFKFLEFGNASSYNIKWDWAVYN
jgi:hypothetical protein